MKTKKQFWELTGLDTTKEDFENNGFRVVNFGMVKKELVAILGNAETAKKNNLWNKFTDPKNMEMQSLPRKILNLFALTMVFPQKKKQQLLRPILATFI